MTNKTNKEPIFEELMSFNGIYVKVIMDSNQNQKAFHSEFLLRLFRENEDKTINLLFHFDSKSQMMENTFKKIGILNKKFSKLTKKSSSKKMAEAMISIFYNLVNEDNEKNNENNNENNNRK